MWEVADGEEEQPEEIEEEKEGNGEKKVKGKEKGKEKANDKNVKRKGLKSLSLWDFDVSSAEISLILRDVSVRSLLPPFQFSADLTLPNSRRNRSTTSFSADQELVSLDSDSPRLFSSMATPSRHSKSCFLRAGTRNPLSLNRSNPLLPSNLKVTSLVNLRTNYLPKSPSTASSSMLSCPTFQT